MHKVSLNIYVFQIPKTGINKYYEKLSLSSRSFSLPTGVRKCIVLRQIDPLSVCSWECFGSRIGKEKIIMRSSKQSHHFNHWPLVDLQLLIPVLGFQALLKSSRPCAIISFPLPQPPRRISSNICWPVAVTVSNGSKVSNQRISMSQHCFSSHLMIPD